MEKTKHFDREKAINSLSEAIKCKTISYIDEEAFDYNEFDKLHQVLKKFFPKVFSLGEVKLFNKSILIKLTGSNRALKPILLMAHQDVVPLNSQFWDNDPFSGKVDDKYIWGRGSEDIKCLMLAHLNACEYILSNYNIERTIYLSFGHDEEVGGFNGSKKIAEYLYNEGERLECVIDEGFGFIDYGTKYGVSNKLIGEIGIFEKGYLDMRLEATGFGGHSSNPFEKTSLEVIANAISKITSNPITPKIPDVVNYALNKLEPHIDLEPLRGYLDRLNSAIYLNNNAQEIKEIKDNILNYFLNDKNLNIYVKTTIAPTVITGSSQTTNVMPNDMSATINFRLNDGDSVDKVMNFYKEIVQNDRLKVSYTRSVEPSRPSNINSIAYSNLEKALNSSYRDVIFIPSITTCGTDARHFECLSDTVLRIYPFLNKLGEEKGIHGVNEKMEKDAYFQGINVIIKFIELMQM